MAEKGAYLTGTAFAKPSIFEIVAQQSFSATLEPAFKRIFSFILSFNPERYGHLIRWADESYAIFNTILQRHYLRKYSASFSETFYGLKRIAVDDSKVQQTLSKSQERLSLLLLVLYPYLKSKLHDLSQKYKLEQLDSRMSTTNRWMKLYRYCVIDGYRLVFILYESLVLYTYIVYISGRSVYPIPLLRFLSITLTYAEPQHTTSVIDLLRKIKSNSFGIGDSVEIFRRTLIGSLEFGAFFLQFLAWWSQEEYRGNIINLPIPPPPAKPELASFYNGLCPVCTKPRRTHTLLAVSGYVFCYQCILPTIRNTGRCPVTRYPAKEDDLIRLYIQ